MVRWLYQLADRLRRRSYADDHGRLGEDLVHRYLRGHGCRVVARNYRTRSGAGEIDLVAWQGRTLAFVEVKCRASNEFGEPERAVDLEKRERLLVAGRDYARRAGVEWKRVRFDIASVVLGQHPRIEWIRDAFRPPAEHDI
ncbi:MAG TPA: YraN family protein [Bryobacteraceae bacterium]|nr:YraN family protein [Bryobacteraceae bacterium]